MDEGDKSRKCQKMQMNMSSVSVTVDIVTNKNKTEYMWCKFPKTISRCIYNRKIQLLVLIAQMWCSAGPLHTETSVIPVRQPWDHWFNSCFVPFVNVDNVDRDHHDATTFSRKLLIELNSRLSFYSWLP